MKSRQLSLIASAITLIGVFAAPAQAVGSDQATMTAPATAQALGSAIHSPMLNLLAKHGADDPAGDDRGGDNGNSGSSSGGSGSGRHCPDGTDDDDPTQPDVCV